MENQSNKLSIPIDFFCDEVRNDFFVSETMKHYWAAQLKVLSEIDQICRRHNCNWFADFGTLLGAVRHKGFIPWDDDIDIAMLREDYELFLYYARKELPQGYLILSIDDNESYDEAFGKIINSSAIFFDDEFLDDNFGCPFIAGVDVFPLDKIYSDAQKEAERTKRATFVYAVYRGMLNNEFTCEETKICIEAIEKENKIKIGQGNVLRKSLLLFNDISKECKEENTNEVALMYRWATDHKCRYPRKFFDEWIELPFETTRVRSSLQYNEILSLYYGDYMTVVKGSAIHDYPVYKKLELLYRERLNRYPSRYWFRKEKFNPRSDRKTLKQKQLEILALMRELHKKINESMIMNVGDVVLSLLESCQKAAVAIGNTLEGKFLNCTHVITLLEAYCESIYKFSTEWDETAEIQLNSQLSDIEKVIIELFDGYTKDILFLPCKIEWWDNMKNAFLKEVADENCAVSVIPIPYFYHDHKQMIGKVLTDRDAFKCKLNINEYITNFDEYNLEKRYPDRIYIQFPFDGYSGTIGIPELLYSDNLLKYTDELIYIPCFNPEAPESKDDVAYRAMHDLVEQPAVFNSDKVLVENEKLCRYYIDKLVEMTDESMREYWEAKIQIIVL